MTLHGAHLAIKAQAQAPIPPLAAPDGAALKTAFDGLRVALVQDITGVGSGVGVGVAAARPAQGVARARGLLAVNETFDDSQANYASFQRRHVHHQRQMDSRIAALRAQARQCLMGASARLRQLAMLDAVMEQMLETRTHKLLAQWPAQLEQRFEQMHQAHQVAVAASGQPDDPLAWRQPGGWLHGFGQVWREALLAELDTRLAPVLGMIEALTNELD